MRSIATFSIGFLLTAASGASEKAVGNKTIHFSQPPGFEELCASRQDIHELLQKGTHPDSLLVTCFVDLQEWSRGEGTQLYKVEVMRNMIDRSFSNEEFAAYVAQAAKEIGVANLKSLETYGDMNTDEKKQVDELLSTRNSPVQLSVHKGMWQVVGTGTRFEILEMNSSLNVQSRDRGALERNVATVMALVNLKGKLLTLKVVNTRNQPDAAQAGNLSMRSWVADLLRDNSN